MIFVDCNTNEWLQKHPGLQILKIDCDACGRNLEANKPFIEKGYAGLSCAPCICGNNKHTCVSKVTTSRDAYNRWMSLVENYL